MRGGTRFWGVRVESGGSRKGRKGNKSTHSPELSLAVGPGSRFKVEGFKIKARDIEP